MTATDVLRRMLDERGVEWDADDEAMDDGSLSQVTYWYCNGIEWSADGRDEYLAFDAVQLLTPEQAIAATLEQGTCHNISKIVDKYGQARFACSECGAWIDSRMLWNPECSSGESPWVKDCSLNFCPNCGRKVVDE